MKLLIAFAVAALIALCGAQTECPVEDPVTLPAGNFNISLHPLCQIFEGSTHGELIAEGVSTAHAEVDINVILLTAQFTVTLETIKIDSTYEASGWIDARPIPQGTIPSGNFTGSGIVEVEATGIEIDGSATLFINIIGNKVSIRILNLDTVKFGTVKVNLGEFNIAGANVDWAEWSSGFVANWDRDFAQFHSQAVEKIRQAANVIVGQYTLAELIDLIGGGGGTTGEPGCRQENKINLRVHA